MAGKSSGPKPEYTPDARWAVKQTLEELERKGNVARASFVLQRAALLLEPGFATLIPTVTPGGVERIRAQGRNKNSYTGLMRLTRSIVRIESRYEQGGNIEIATLVVDGRNTEKPQIEAFVTDQFGKNRDELDKGDRLLDALAELDELRAAPAARDLGTVALSKGIFLHESLLVEGTVLEGA